MRHEPFDRPQLKRLGAQEQQQLDGAVTVAFAWAIAIAAVTTGGLTAKLLGSQWRSWFELQSAVDAKRFSFTLVTAVGTLMLAPGIILGWVALGVWVGLTIALKARKDWALPLMVAVYLLDTALACIVIAKKDLALILSLFGFVTFGLRIMALGSWLRLWWLAEGFRRRGFALERDKPNAVGN